MDEIDATDYTDDIPLVTKGKDYQDYKRLDSEYWEDDITKTVTSQRMKIHMTILAEGCYMFNKINVLNTRTHIAIIITDWSKSLHNYRDFRFTLKLLFNER